MNVVVRKNKCKALRHKRGLQVGQEQGDGFLLFLFSKSSILRSAGQELCLPCLLHLRQGKCAVTSHQLTGVYCAAGVRFS